MATLRALSLALLCTIAAPTWVAAQVGSITGTVTDTNGAPVAGAFVIASGGSGGGFGGIFGGGGIGFTAVDGSYTIANLTTGTYTVEAQRFGYLPASAVVDVTAGGTAIADLALAAPQVGSISGTVIDANTGNPIAGAWVALQISGSSPGGIFGAAIAQVALTDANGNYSIPNVEVGTRDLQVSATGYFSETITVDVLVGQDTVADVSLDPLGLGSISGVVSDAQSGAPIAGAFVAMFGSFTGGAFGVFPTFGLTLTDAQGAYSFPNVPAGAYTVQTFARAYEAGSEMTTVTAGQDSVVDFDLAPLLTGSIAGNVSDASSGQPIAGAFVFVPTAGGAVTDANGDYTIDEVPVGTADVLVFVPGYPTGSQSVPILENQTTTVDFDL